VRNYSAYKEPNKREGGIASVHLDHQVVHNDPLPHAPVLPDVHALKLADVTNKGMVRSDISKPALIFLFTARVHTTKSNVKILAANTHCK
jgi:hypothetical protein